MKYLGKISVSLLLICCVFFGLSACGGPKVTAIEYVSGVAESVVIGNELDLSNISVRATFDDGTTKDINKKDLSIDTSKVNMETEGYYPIKISYGGKDVTLNVYVNAHDYKLNVDHSAIANGVSMGTDLMTDIKSKLVVSYNYKLENNTDAPSVTLTDDKYTVTSDYDKTKAGEYKFTVKYRGISSSFNVEVKTPTLSVTAPEFPIVQGSNLKDKITVLFSDGVNPAAEITNYTITGYDENKLCPQEVTISYTFTNGDFEKTLEQKISTISVAQFDLSGSTLNVLPGTTVNFDTLLQVKWYNEADGSYQILNSQQYTIEGFDPSIEIGTQTLTLKYNNTSTQFKFTISYGESGGDVNMQEDGKQIRFVGYTYSYGSSESTITNFTLFNSDNTAAVPQSKYNLRYDNESKTYFIEFFQTGDYTLRYDKDAESKTLPVRVVPKLASLAYGDNYTAYLTTLDELNKPLTPGDDSSTNSAAKFMDRTARPYEIGTGDSFHFDISMIDELGNDITDTNVLNFKFYKKVDANFVELTGDELNNFVEFDAQNGTFKFNATLADNNVTYKAVAKSKFQTMSDLNFTFLLTTGVNVFTHNDLVAKFANLNNQKILLHANIVAEVTQDQLNEGGSIKNYFNENFMGNNLIDAYEAANGITNENAIIAYNADGTLKWNKSGMIYVRVSNHANNDNLVFNGNYFTVNARNIPIVDPAVSKDQAGQAGYLIQDAQNPNSYATSSQVSVFYINVKTANFNNNIDQAKSDVNTYGAFNETKTGLQYADNFNAVENNKATIKNISIIGNSSTPSGDSTDDERMLQISKNSGSLALIRFQSDVDVDNAVLRYACIGVYLTDRGVDSKISNSYISDVWANDIFAYICGKIEVTNSYAGAAGGTAIWLEDHTQANGEVFDPYLIFDDTVIIDNYVVGSEPWFVAQKINAVIPGAKTMINDAISTMSGSTKTLIKHVENPSGGTSEVFNFAIVVSLAYTKDTGINAGDNLYNNISYRYNYNGSEVVRLPDSGDPRVAEGTFAAAVDQYSNTETFLTTVNNCTTQALTAVATKLQGQDPSFGSDINSLFAQAMYKAVMGKLGNNLVDDALSTVAANLIKDLTITHQNLTAEATQLAIAGAMGNLIIFNSFNSDANLIEVNSNIANYSLCIITEFFPVSA